MQTGSLAELLSAFGTLAALVFAGLAARAAMRTSRQQGEQLRLLEEAERRRELEAEREDAERVAFWTGVTGEEPGVYYSNQTGLPVYELTVLVLVPGLAWEVHYSALGPADRPRPLKRVRRTLTARPDDTATVDWVGLLATDAFRCAAVFRDTAGRWWTRDTSGLLTAHPDLASARAATGPRP